jgi:integrase
VHATEFRQPTSSLGRTRGSGREALVPDGETLATTDPVIAQALLTDRVKELEAKKRNRVVLGIEEEATLESFAARHLVLKAESGRVTDSWLENTERMLRRAVEFFGAERDLTTIGVRDVQRFNQWLGQRDNGRGGKLGASSIRDHLAAVSNLYVRAAGEACVPPGYNPVAALMDKPARTRQEARWLEIHDAALLLEAARTYPYHGPEGRTVGDRLGATIRDVLGPGPVGEGEFIRRMRSAGKLADEARLRAYLTGARLPTRDYVLTAAGVLGVPEDRLWRKRGWLAPQRPSPAMHPLIATFLLTGGREAEVLGLEVGDVNFERKTITFRPNGWRRLKTPTSFRVVPLWPQLEEILRAYLESDERPTGALLFPSERSEKEAMITDWRKSLDTIAERAGWKPGEIRSKMFRHTYCAARLQTTDRGAPVSVYTVSQEMGHGGEQMTRRVYAHLGQQRHRSEVVEYRVDQHEVTLGDRLRRLRLVA